MKFAAIAAVLALSSVSAAAAPQMTKLTHANGETTIVSTTASGSTATGWYGGAGVTTPKSHEQMIKEATSAGQDKGNKVIKREVFERP